MSKRKEYTKNACTNCARAKRKCEWEPTEEKCFRCKSQCEPCVLKTQKKRGRKSKKDMRQIFASDPDYKFSESEG